MSEADSARLRSAAPARGGLARVVEPEELDGLAADDPAAQRSRRDLRRVHRVMRTRSVVTRALLELMPRAPARPLRILELGAGDGTLMLGVARALAPRGWRAQFTLLDRAPCVDAGTLAAYAQVGWTANVLASDVLRDIDADPAAAPTGWTGAGRWDVIVTTLFLHHFTGAALDALIGAVARSTRVFVACEPRRALLALGASHLAGVIGAGPVTRKDAVLSVHAGFAGAELSALWPPDADRWQLSERPAALFSHLFSARRLGDDPRV